MLIYVLIKVGGTPPDPKCIPINVLNDDVSLITVVLRSQSNKLFNLIIGYKSLRFSKAFLVHPAIAFIAIDTRKANNE